MDNPFILKVESSSYQEGAHMRGCSKIPVRFLSTVLVTTALGWILPTQSQAGLSALVPAYFAPGTGGAGGVGDGWSQMTDAASTISITAIMNPNSGPGDVGQVDAYQTVVGNLQKAGGSVIGYVDTGNGSVALSTVESNIQIYLSSHVNLNGFFLDQVSPWVNLNYYQTLYSYIKNLDSSHPYEVVGNVGTPFLNGLTPAQFLSVADKTVIFEGPNSAPAGQAGFNNYPYGLDWMTTGGYSSDRFVNLIHTTPSVSDMQSDVLKASSLNAGSVYITDGTLPNPWNQLPSYWNEEVAALAAVPEPSSLIVASTCCLAGILMTWRRGRLSGV
jgi:hypothetical protein